MEAYNHDGLVEEYGDDFDDFYVHRDEVSDELFGKDFDELNDAEIEEVFKYFYQDVLDKKDEYSRDFSEIVEEVNEKIANRGIYRLALKMDNPLVIDANGSMWDDITLSTEIEKKYTAWDKSWDKRDSLTTREIARFAKENGYDGVIFENVEDVASYDYGAEPDTVYIVFDGKQVKSLDPVTYDDDGKVIPLSERFTDADPDIRYHLSGQAAPRFSETQEGKVAVAEVFDAMTEGMWDLISDPTARSQRKGVKKQKDVTTEEGFAKEVNVRMGQFGRAGGKRLQEVKKNLSAEQWQDVLGTVFEVGHRFDVWHEEGGLLDASMRRRVADYLQDIIRNRASALGRRSYIAGRQYAWRIAKEAEAEAVAEAKRKGKEKLSQEKERNAKKQAELKAKAKQLAGQFRWDLAEERFIADYRVAKAKALASKRIESIRAEAAEELKASRQRLARKQAAWREVGITMKQLIPQLGMDVGEELVRSEPPAHR